MTGTVEPTSWKATDYLDEPDIVRDIGLTAVDAWTVAEVGQPGRRYDPRAVTRSSE